MGLIYNQALETLILLETPSVKVQKTSKTYSNFDVIARFSDPLPWHERHGRYIPISEPIILGSTMDYSGIFRSTRTTLMFGTMKQVETLS